MNKIMNTILCTFCCILALYGLIVLIRKIKLAPDAERKPKKDLSYSFYLEPYRQLRPFLEVGETPEDPVLTSKICRDNCNKKCNEQFPNNIRNQSTCKRTCLIDYRC